MSITLSAAQIKRLNYNTSRASSTSSHGSSDTNFSGSQVSLPNSVISAEIETEELWRTLLTPKLFTSPLENKFLCVSCMRVLVYPISLSQCEHHVCSTCFGNLCRRKRVCPSDGKRFVREESIANKKLENKMKSLQLECPHKHCGCGWTGILENFKDHYNLCEHSEKLCPNGCNFRGNQRMMEAHLASDCPLRPVTCDFCKKPLSAQQEIEHLKFCPRLPVSCPKLCGAKDIPREEISNHINTTCTKADFTCPYQLLGCAFKSGRDGLEEHVENCLKQHLNLLCEAVIEHGRLLTDQEERLKICRETITDHENKLALLVQDSSTQFLWKISDWSSKMAQAVSGKKPLIQSLPFLTGRHQYKLCLSLLPNGDRKAKGVFISLYVRICKGEYDALLPWPFSQSMDLILVDQSQDPRAKLDFVYTLRPNPCKENLPFLGKPTSESNPSFGPQNFVLHSLLSTRDYVRDDTIFIRVCVHRSVLMQ